MTDEQRAERLYHHKYSTEGRVEQCERIVALEELVIDMWWWTSGGTCEACPLRDRCEAHESGNCGFLDDVDERMRELGLAPEGLPTCE